MRHRPHRHKTYYPVLVEAPCGRHSAAISDVNEDGAQLRNTANLIPGDAIAFEVQQAQVSAVVRWAKNNRAGVAFDPKISIDQMDAIRNCFNRRNPPSTPTGMCTVL